MIITLSLSNQGGVGSVGGEGEAVTRKVRVKEKTVSPPCLFHPPDAGEDVVVIRILYFVFFSSPCFSST